MQSPPGNQGSIHTPGTGGGDGGELSVEDLVGALGRAPGLGALKKKLARVEGGELPLAVPLPPTVQGRLERKAAYEAGAKDIGKWRAQVPQS
jgi:U3 small nucleolar RNA-associated protein 14